MGTKKDPGGGAEREIWRAMGRTLRDKRDPLEMGLLTDECAELERCTPNVECNVFEKILLVMNRGETMGRLIEYPTPCNFDIE